MTSIGNGREKGEARQIVADFGSKGLVRLTTQGTAYSDMKPGRTPGIGNSRSLAKWKRHKRVCRPTNP